MAYTLQAIIGDEDDLKRHSIAGATVIALPQGKALLPICKSIRARFEIPFLEFGHTDAALDRVAALIAQLKIKKAAYVEAEFFGGDGGQSSAIWEGNRLVFGPVVSEHAIDKALRILGVEKADAFDEFEALGLGRYRDTEDWIQ